MACGSCGGKRQSVSYEITYKHDGSREVITPQEGGLATVRVRLAASQRGGTYKALPSK
jgi:hypothetical protein